MDNLLTAATEPDQRFSQILSALNHVTTKMDLIHSNMITSHISSDNNVVKCCENGKADQINWDGIRNLKDLLDSASIYSTERRLQGVFYLKCKACYTIVLYSPEVMAYQTRIKRHDTFT